MSAQILRLRVDRFRGLESLTWHPGSGVNLIMGGGDVGKTTLLEAIELLLYPSNYFVLSDTDFWRRNVEDDFQIEGVFRLPEELLSQQAVMNWPWIWSGDDVSLPDPDDLQATGTEAAYLLRVRGTKDLELTYEVVQPDGETAPFPVGLRRSIGLLRLLTADRNERDLRLVQGSGLDRVVGDDGLRPRLGKELAAEDVNSALLQPGQEALADLDERFASRSLPSGLKLGIIGGPGASVGAMVGLTAELSGVRLPLLTWGSGTRRLASLAIADQLQSGHPITLVDEIERGLEPYRQRRLACSLLDASSQTFVTSHSPVSVAALADAALWHLDTLGQIGSISAAGTAEHRRQDPETFLARLPIICEGATEVGFMSYLFEEKFGLDLFDEGIHLSDAGGNDKALGLLSALVKGGVQVGAIVDNEGRSPKRWEALQKELGGLLLQWPDGCLEQHVIPLIDETDLEALIIDPSGGNTGMRLRHLADRLDIDDKSFPAIQAEAGDTLHELIIAAAIGQVPEGVPKEDRKQWKSQSANWFKSREGGRELAEKVISLNGWTKLRPEIQPLFSAVAERLQINMSDE